MIPASAVGWVPYAFVFATSAGGLIGSIGGAVTPEWTRIFPAVRSPRPW